MQRVSKTVKDEEGEIEVYDWEQWVRNRWRKWVKARAIITEERWQRSGGPDESGGDHEQISDEWVRIL